MRIERCSLYIILSILLICVSCSSRQKFTDDDPGLPPQGIHSSERMILFLQNKMSHEGIRVITMGQNYLISIPSAAIFYNQSPNIRWKSYALLNDVACYLQQFRKISVHINVFGTCYLSKHRTYALTLARSRAVGDYLGSQGIDSRFIFTRGLANDTPIVERVKENDASPNSRIEITFRSAVS
jgi:intracellular multiplication protein IcmN